MYRLLCWKTCDQKAPSRLYAIAWLLSADPLSGVGDVLVLPVTHARNSLRLPSLLYVHVPLQRIDMTRILSGMLVSHSMIYFTLLSYLLHVLLMRISERKEENNYYSRDKFCIKFKDFFLNFSRNILTLKCQKI